MFGLAAAVVPGFALLLVLRGLEGLALAGLPAVGMAYLADEIDGEHLGGAMGLYIAGNSVGGFGGRIIVSAIADLTGSWRWALGGIALVSGAFLVAFVLVLPVSRRFRPRPVGVGELLGAARAHLRDPVLRRFYAVGLLAMGVFVCAYNYVTFLLLGPPFRLPALVVGFVFVLYALGTATSTRTGRLADRVGTRTVLLGGVGIFILGLALLAVMVSAEGGYLSVLPGLIVVSVGIGLCMTPATMIITESLPPEQQGVASALNDTVRELGSAIGVALLGSLLSAGYRSSVSSATGDLSPELAHRVEEGIGSAIGATGDLGPAAPSVLAAARDALVDGWRLSMWVGVAIASGVLVYLVVRGPRAADAGEDVLDVTIADDAVAFEPAAGA